MRSAAAKEVLMGDGRQSASSSGSSAKADAIASSGDSSSRGAASQPSDGSGLTETCLAGATRALCRQPSLLVHFNPAF